MNKLIPKVCINACGLHVGGGVQVAVSFLDELSHLEVEDLDLHLFVSTEIDANLEKISSKIRLHKNYKVLDVHGLAAFLSRFNFSLRDFSLIFTVFGPSYLYHFGFIEIMGFAQPWIVNSTAYSTLPLPRALANRVKFFIQSLFFRRAKKLIVELDHVKFSLERKGIAKAHSIEVVHNCISSIYLNSEKWESLPKIENKINFSVGFVGRDYPHKNTSILPHIKDFLKFKYGLDVDFVVTLNNNEWESKSDHFRKNVINVGTLSVAQCPTLYQRLDAVIFPSLLECFSATPLEAMAMGKPLFASNRRFVRDVCGDFAHYFDPLNAESAADIIASYITDYHGTDSVRLHAAREHALNFSSARRRAERYIEIIRQTLCRNSNGISVPTY